LTFGLKEPQRANTFLRHQGSFVLASHDHPVGGSPASLAQLNERSREIFRLIVESYLATGEPVGSRNLSRILPMTLSPASVRNVMSDLEQLGLVYAPHTSAGRLPTEIGLRFFVDALMQIGDLTENDRKAIEAQVAGEAAGRGQSKTIEAVLTEASGLLSGLSRAAGVVLTAKSNQRLKHVEFVRLEPERALVVLVGEDGQIENRVLNIPVGLPTSALVEASNFLNARIRGRTLADLKLEIERRLKEGQAELDELTQKIVAAGLASWSGGGHDERKLIVRGQAHLLEDLKALADLERVRLLFDDLETRRAGRRRAHLHRFGEQAVFAVGLVHDRRALSRCFGPDRRRARRDRADPAELRPHHPDGGLHRQSREQIVVGLSICTGTTRGCRGPGRPSRASQAAATA
jgi:heat-inducible transcriptional repressor